MVNSLFTSSACLTPPSPGESTRSKSWKNHGVVSVMLGPKRMQLAVSRLSDTLSSILAFLLAYKGLAYIRETLRPESALYSQIFGPFSPAKGIGAAAPAIAELSWVFVVTTVAMLLILDFPYNFKPFHHRTDGQIVVSTLIAIAAALGSTTTVI